jgi:hypothetical protein
LHLLLHSSLITALQRNGTLTTIVSFTRPISAENESLLTPFIGCTKGEGVSGTVSSAPGKGNAT